jgi:hypothetical protein
MARSVLDVSIPLLVWGGILMWRGFRNHRTQRQVEDMATSPVGSAPQGLVEVFGQAYSLKGSQNLVQDCLGLPCVFVETRIEIRGRDERNWKTFGRSKMFGGRFVLEDPSGSVHVIATGATLHFREEIIPWEQVPEIHQGRLMERLGVKIGGLQRLVGKFRVVERKLLPGSPVYVLGALRSRAHEPTAEILGPRGEARTVQPIGGIMKHSVHPLVIADVSEKELLHRIKGGTLKMIFGAMLVSVAVLLVWWDWNGLRY